MKIIIILIFWLTSILAYSTAPTRSEYAQLGVRLSKIIIHEDSLPSGAFRLTFCPRYQCNVVYDSPDHPAPYLFCMDKSNKHYLLYGLIFVEIIQTDDHIGFSLFNNQRGYQDMAMFVDCLGKEFSIKNLPSRKVTLQSNLTNATLPPVDNSNVSN